jgi:hypothetical protein
MEQRSVNIEARIAQSDIGWRNFNPHHMRGRSFQFYREFKENGLGGIILNAGLLGISKVREILAKLKAIASDSDSVSYQLSVAYTTRRSLPGRS